MMTTMKMTMKVRAFSFPAQFFAPGGAFGHLHTAADAGQVQQRAGRLLQLLVQLGLVVAGLVAPRPLAPRPLGG